MLLFGPAENTWKEFLRAASEPVSYVYSAVSLRRTGSLSAFRLAGHSGGSIVIGGSFVPGGNGNDGKVRGGGRVD